MSTLELNHPKTKTAHLKPGLETDFWVARTLGHRNFKLNSQKLLILIKQDWVLFAPSTDLIQAFTLIEKNKIDTFWCPTNNKWSAMIWKENHCVLAAETTMESKVMAALCVFIISVFGTELTPIQQAMSDFSIVVDDFQR